LEIAQLQRRFRRQLRTGEKVLSANCPWLTKWIARSGKCTWEVAWEREPYEALIRAIAHQQLHGKAAQSILQRFEAGFRGDGFPAPRKVLRAKTDKLRAMGFSNAKVSAIQGIAAAAINGEIPTRIEAQLLTDDALIDRLISLRGVGRWTVEMLLIFTLGRMDVMPIDDYGIKSGLKVLRNLKTMPGRKDFSALTSHWQPYRSLAAWYLWRLADLEKLKNR
jgi:DNA-3-methyladenine glycosylase II